MPVMLDGQPKELLIEQCTDFSFIQEEMEGRKYHIIEGIFLQFGIPNKNRRYYSMEKLEPEVNRYINEMVATNRAVGELGHPAGPLINPERVSHRITSLIRSGNNFIGKARVSNSPFGKIVQNFLDEETKFGVSSRAIGTLKREGGIDHVQHDFRLATAADIVMDPSAPDAFVRGLMENKEYLLADGMIQEADFESWKNAIKTASSHSLHEVELKTYSDFLSQLGNRFKI